MRKPRFGKVLLGAMSSALVLSMTVVPGDYQAAVASQREPVVQQHHVDPSSSFQNLNGVMWYYSTYFGYKFKDINKDLDNLKDKGIRVLGFFSPYFGDKNLCAGCDPLDFYTVPPQNGTLQDWKNLVAAAHRKGMKVISYFTNIYMDSNSTYFKTAEQQYAAGDRTSREVSSFHWTTNPADPLPTLRSGPPFASSWQYSTTAGAYYWKLWFGPGFDFDLPGNTAEVDRIEKFWLNTGLDGFMWDVGRPDSRFTAHAIDLP